MTTSKPVQEQKTWWFRMQPRSITKTIEYLPYFCRLEGYNWDEKLENVYSSYFNTPIHPQRRKYLYSVHEDLQDKYKTYENYLKGNLDDNETESRARNEKVSFEFFGFAYVNKNGVIKVTKVGNLIKEALMSEDILLKQLLKLQFPSPINSRKFGNKFVFPMEIFLKALNEFEELNRYELGFLFGCMSIDEIHSTIDAIKDFRCKYNKISDKQKNETKIKNLFKEIFAKTYGVEKGIGKFYGDYADAFCRCLEYTGLFGQSGRGNFQKIFINKHASLKVSMLMSNYVFKYNYEADRDTYMEWYGDTDNVILPWENELNRKQIIEYKKQVLSTNIKDASQKIVGFDDSKYKNIISLDLKKITSITELSRVETELTKLIVDLNENLFSNYYSKTKTVRKEIVDKFKAIENGTEDFAALWMECNTWKSLIAIDGDHSIKRNFKIEDNLTPKAFAPGIGNTPDMELYGNNYILIPEVSLMTGVRQWEHEGSSVIDHVLKFVQNNEEKNVYGIFISSKINIRTLWQFYILNKESWMKKPVPVIPITISQYISIIDFIYTYNLTIEHLKTLIEDVHKKSFLTNNYEEWEVEIDSLIRDWQKQNKTYVS